MSADRPVVMVDCPADCDRGWLLGHVPGDDYCCNICDGSSKVPDDTVFSPVTLDDLDEMSQKGP